MFILKHEKGMPYTNGFTSLIVERVYDVLVLAVLGLCSLPFLISLVPEDYGWFVWLIIFVLIAGKTVVIECLDRIGIVVGKGGHAPAGIVVFFKNDNLKCISKLQCCRQAYES